MLIKGTNEKLSPRIDLQSEEGKASRKEQDFLVQVYQVAKF